MEQLPKPSLSDLEDLPANLIELRERVAHAKDWNVLDAVESLIRVQGLHLKLAYFLSGNEHHPNCEWKDLRELTSLTDIQRLEEQDIQQQPYSRSLIFRLRYILLLGKYMNFCSSKGIPIDLDRMHDVTILEFHMHLEMLARQLES